MWATRSERNFLFRSRSLRSEGLSSLVDTLASSIRSLSNSWLAFAGSSAGPGCFRWSRKVWSGRGYLDLELFELGPRFFLQELDEE